MPTTLRRVAVLKLATLTLHSAVYCYLFSSHPLSDLSQGVFLLFLLTVVIGLLGLLLLAFSRENSCKFLSSKSVHFLCLGLTALAAFQLVFSMHSVAYGAIFDPLITYLRSCFTDTVIQEAISLTFNLVRFGLLLWVAYGLAQAFRAADRQEDWGTVLRTPMSAVALAIASDLVFRLLIGGSTSCT